ncbi:MAG: hypothetical protein ACYDDA_04940 [Acidiferrobacteraceae bacterium]
MTRTGSAWTTAAGAVGGLLVGLVGGRLATGSISDSSTRANVVLLSSSLFAAAGAGIASYASSKNLLAS